MGSPWEVHGTEKALKSMVEYDKIYPGYDFASNKGYGTAKHIDALKLQGSSPIHRKTFIKNINTPRG